MRQESYLNRPLSCAVDAAGDLIFADFNHRLRREPTWQGKGVALFYKVYLFGDFVGGYHAYIDISYIYILIHILYILFINIYLLFTYI